MNSESKLCIVNDCENKAWGYAKKCNKHKLSPEAKKRASDKKKQVRLHGRPVGRTCQWRETDIDHLALNRRYCTKRHMELACTTRKYYNITPKQYHNLVKKQNGVCVICKEVSILNGNGSIDHDHNCCPSRDSCGKCVRGILCVRCNFGIGQFKDNVGILQNAIEYLLQWQDLNIDSSPLSFFRESSLVKP